jgi:hypothetical protein
MRAVVLLLCLGFALGTDLKCYKGACGCDMKKDWCTYETAPLQGDWCNTNEANCGNCGGEWCERQVDYVEASGRCTSELNRIPPSLDNFDVGEYAHRNDDWDDSQSPAKHDGTSHGSEFTLEQCVNACVNDFSSYSFTIHNVEYECHDPCGCYCVCQSSCDCMKDTSASYNYDVSTYFLDKNWNGALPGDCTGADGDDDDYFDFLFDQSARDGDMLSDFAGVTGVNMPPCFIGVFEENGPIPSSWCGSPFLGLCNPCVEAFFNDVSCIGVSFSYSFEYECGGNSVGVNPSAINALFDEADDYLDILFLLGQAATEVMACPLADCACCHDLVSGTCAEACTETEINVAAITYCDVEDLPSRCFKSKCGCPDYTSSDPGFNKAWCYNGNPFVGGEWCNENGDNCGNCGGDWCVWDPTSSFDDDWTHDDYFDARRLDTSKPATNSLPLQRLAEMKKRDDSEALAAGFKKFLASLPDEGPKSKDNVLRFLKTVPEESEESKRITEGALLHFQAAKRRHTKSGTGAFDAAGALKEALLSLKGSK